MLKLQFCKRITEETYQAFKLLFDHKGRRIPCCELVKSGGKRDSGNENPQYAGLCLCNLLVASKVFPGSLSSGETGFWAQEDTSPGLLS